jgi:DNA-binding phage protein
MAKASRNFDEYLMEQLQDPEEAAAYIDAVLEDGDESVLILALRDLERAGKNR